MLLCAQCHSFPVLLHSLSVLPSVSPSQCQSCPESLMPSVSHSPVSLIPSVTYAQYQSCSVSLMPSVTHSYLFDSIFRIFWFHEDGGWRRCRRLGWRFTLDRCFFAFRDDGIACRVDPGLATSVDAGQGRLPSGNRFRPHLHHYWCWGRGHPLWLIKLELLRPDHHGRTALEGAHHVSGDP